jgi:hypothetical protein
VLTVVNFAGDESSGHVILPSSCSFIKGKQCVLQDYLSDQKLEKSGGQLLGENGGVWFKLGGWESRIYKIVCE